MKKIISKLSIVNNNKTSAILALLIVSLIVLGCGGKPEMPAESASQTLVKNSMSDLADAVDKNDFKAFREKASKDFQATVSEDKLKTTFASFVEKKDIIVPILREAAGKDTKFSPAPAMREESGNYILVAGGTTDTADSKVKIDNEYVWRDGAWKLLKVMVNFQ